MRKNWKTRMAALVLGAALLGGVAFATQGSESDPLVSLSYLTKVFAPSVLAKADEAFAGKEQGYVDKLQTVADGYVEEMERLMGEEEEEQETQAASVFAVVDLAQGQTLLGDIGCEVMLRVGTAHCVSPSSPGLIDSTDGSTLAPGKALVKNHLYLFTITDRGVQADAAVKILVRGSYTIQ